RGPLGDHPLRAGAAAQSRRGTSGPFRARAGVAHQGRLRTQLAHRKEVHVDDNIQIGDEASDFGKKALGVGVAALVLAMVLGGSPFSKQFAQSYLVAFMYV